MQFTFAEKNTWKYISDVIYGGGWHRREIKILMIFLNVKFLLAQPLKIFFSYRTLNIKLKNPYPPLAKNFAKEYHSDVTHVLCRNCPQTKRSCCLHVYCHPRHHLLRAVFTTGLTLT